MNQAERPTLFIMNSIRKKSERTENNRIHWSSTEQVKNPEHIHKNTTTGIIILVTALVYFGSYHKTERFGHGTGNTGLIAGAGEP